TTRRTVCERTNTTRPPTMPFVRLVQLRTSDRTWPTVPVRKRRQCDCPFGWASVGKRQRTTVAGQAPVGREGLFHRPVGRDAVAAGLLGESVIVGRDGSERPAYCGQQRGSRLLDDVSLVHLERANSVQHGGFQVAQ